MALIEAAHYFQTDKEGTQKIMAKYQLGVIRPIWTMRMGQQ